MAASTKKIEDWFVWYGVPHFVLGFEKLGSYFEQSSPRLARVRSVPILSEAAWAAFQAPFLFLWVIRRMGENLEHLRSQAARALPMLAVITILGFFSSDLWEIAADMSDYQLLGVFVFFAAVGIVFLWARLKKEINEKWPDDCSCSGAEITAAWNKHYQRLPPREEVLDPLQLTEGRPELERAQKRNMRVYLWFCQVIQVGLLTSAVWLFFLILGRITITTAILGQWFNGGPRYPEFIPHWVSTQLLAATSLMAILAGLIFTVQTVTDESYRQEFFISTVDGLTEAVRVRCAYIRLLNPPE